MHRCPECGRTFEAGEIFCPFDGTRLSAAILTKPDSEPPDPLVGTVLAGRYPLDRVLGRGGMGTVYASKRGGAPCAVKVLRHVDDDGEALARFEREARMATKLGQEHIVEVFDFAQTDAGHSFMVMELLQGEDLGDCLARDTCLPLERAGGIILQCCSGLGAAHAVGIVHRDLKPENIFLIRRAGDPDFVKIVDFGLAKMQDIEASGDPTRKLTKTGMIFGTPQYMSPEQAMGRKVDHRADIYSLGVIFFELLAGRVPFDGNNFMSILNQHMLDPPPPIEPPTGSGIPADVQDLVMRCLSKVPDDRPQSMGEVGRGLAKLLVAHGHPEVAKRHPVRVAEPIERRSVFPSSLPGARRPGVPVPKSAHVNTSPGGIDPSEARSAAASRESKRTQLESVPPPAVAPSTSPSAVATGQKTILSIPPPAGVPQEAHGVIPREEAVDPSRVAAPRGPAKKAGAAWAQTAPAGAAFAKTEYGSIPPAGPASGVQGRSIDLQKTIHGSGDPSESNEVPDFAADARARTQAGVPLSADLATPAPTRPSNLPVSTMPRGSVDSGKLGAKLEAKASAAPPTPTPTPRRPSNRPPRLGPEQAVPVTMVAKATRQQRKPRRGIPVAALVVGALTLLLLGAALGYALLEFVRH